MEYAVETRKSNDEPKKDKVVSFQVIPGEGLRCVMESGISVDIGNEKLLGGSEKIPHNARKFAEEHQSEAHTVVFVSINNAKQIFKSFFGDKLGELELEGLMLKADLNNNGKIEIEELTSFLRKNR